MTFLWIQPELFETAVKLKKTSKKLFSQQFTNMIVIIVLQKSDQIVPLEVRST